MSLLISTVLSGSRNRLAPLPELPCTMPGIAVAVLGADDQHVAAVAVGDDLLLQILRRVLAAQIRLERAAQPRPLLAQPIAQAPQLRARIVHDLAAGIDLAADVGDLALERRGAVGDGAQDAESRRARGGSGAQVASTEARNVASASRCSGSSARPSTASASRIASRSAGARSAISLVRRESATVSAVAASAAATARGVGQRLQPREPRSSRRRLREAADRLDNPIEFEGPQGAGLHGIRRD